MADNGGQSPCRRCPILEAKISALRSGINGALRILQTELDKAPSLARVHYLTEIQSRLYVALEES